MLSLRSFSPPVILLRTGSNVAGINQSINQLINHPIIRPLLSFSRCLLVTRASTSFATMRSSSRSTSTRDSRCKIFYFFGCLIFYFDFIVIKVLFRFYLLVFLERCINSNSNASNMFVYLCGYFEYLPLSLFSLHPPLFPTRCAQIFRCSCPLIPEWMS